MKKNYVKPEMAVEEIEPASIIATSPGGVSENGDVIDLNGSPQVGNGSDAASKMRDPWDEGSLW